MQVQVGALPGVGILQGALAVEADPPGPDAQVVAERAPAHENAGRLQPAGHGQGFAVEAAAAFNLPAAVVQQFQVQFVYSECQGIRAAR